MSDEFPKIRPSDAAPFVNFDIAPTYGVFNGAIQIELAGRVLNPIENGGVTTEFVITGHIRCSPQAAEYLRDALEKSLEMLKKPQTPDTAARGRLN